MIDFFIKVKQQLALDLPFVIYHKPKKSKLIGFFQKNDHLFLVETFKERGFVFAPFDGNQKILIPVNESSRWETIIPTVELTLDTLPEIVRNDSDKSSFENLVRNGIQKIEEGLFDKVVLSRREKLELDSFDCITTFEKLLALYPNAFTYCWYHPKIGMWMGASPERLVKANSKQFCTTALAGTQPFLTNKRTVVWLEKEQKEQQFVTDSILECIKPFISEVVVSSPYTAQAGNLLHIKTDVEGTLKRAASLQDIVVALHPTPAVCGLPKDTAKTFILQYEGYDRSYYTGYMGELNIKGDYENKPKSHFFVNLRCMQIKRVENSPQANVYLYVGCGVTKESEPEKEWEESVNKSLTMKRVLFG